MKDLSASIVVYKNQVEILEKTIDSFLGSTVHSKLYIVDNSPTDELKALVKDPRIIYRFNNKNVGFGAAHNTILRQILDETKYHIILNPDVYFDESTIGELYGFMEKHSEIGQVMPKVLYPDGRLQPLCKLLPTPQTLIKRRFLNFYTTSLEKENYRYELRFSGYDKIMDVPFLSGCFMFLRTEALKQTGLFDEQFFLYTEDADLSRRIHKLYRTVYYPQVTIYHYHQRGSYRNFWLMWCNIRSAIRYFNKWGWINDREREFFNRRTIEQLAHIS
ncbi:MAG TPA: glycosyltransferase family 2 protein [Chryseolinea sp.]